MDAAKRSLRHSMTTDYLIVGAGAVGLAFADTLLSEKSDVELTITDRRAQPGGHWNDAYSFVALHQPSAFYGVNSLSLGSGLRDTHGANKGLYELASSSVMRRRLLPSGRVRYLPMTDHLGGGRIRSLLTGDEAVVAPRRRIVDTTFYGTSVPSTHTPKFSISEGVNLIAPNALTHFALFANNMFERYTIVGAGKTAMDVGVWLLGAEVLPGRITWIMPRDSWLWNRRATQPDSEFFEDVVGSQAAQMEACATATSADEIFERLEAAGTMLRIFPEVRPTMFHYATISIGEVEALRTIDHVVRLGRVRTLELDRAVLDAGEIELPERTLHIDCTASAVEKRQPVPIFQDERIVCQLVRAPQPAFSAALIAWVEAHGVDDEDRNYLCGTVPFPDHPHDYPRTVLANMRNEAAWAKKPHLRTWIKASRLDGFGKIVDAVRHDDAAKMALLARLRAAAEPAIINLRRLVTESDRIDFGATTMSPERY
ncbi:NAD(P)-binding protein [Rhizobium laguerreae]|uniref:NAD(P)-binding protein n=3 Tax=Rhizobium laguerreae TaxID=1076926 RepID=UPI0014428C54|nr:FAD/NAD(P)-binding protein [Rhizobium laguerreae]NKM28210.1 NAD(P)-binding protein [Rhizobium laguerreae]